MKNKDSFILKLKLHNVTNNHNQVFFLNLFNSLHSTIYTKNNLFIIFSNTVTYTNKRITK